MLAALEYMFHGGCRETSKVLDTAFEPIGNSAIHGLAKKLSEASLAGVCRERSMMAVDGTKLGVEGRGAYVWAVVDADAGELLAPDASYRRPSLDAYLFLGKL